jgi:hypothetical protein
MAKSLQRLQALKLRRQGKSIKKIAQQLDVSRASASTWCRDITLTTAQRERLTRNQIKAGHKGRMIGAEMNRLKKMEDVKRQEQYAREMIGKLSDRDILLLGTALYWGEGVKASNSALAVVNSDPAVILFASRWFSQLGVSQDMLHPAIYISESHRHRRRALLQFWATILKIPESQFAKPVFLRGRPKKIYENHNSYYGVLALRVRRGASMKYRILGLIKACKESAGVAQLVRASHS